MSSLSDIANYYYYGDDFSKSEAEEKRVRQKRGSYRNSLAQAINPRSRTYVREGSGGRRFLRSSGGAAAGSLAGSAIGAGIGAATRRPQGSLRGARIGGSLGGMAGGTAGYNQNVKSGDTVSFNRRSGKKAKGKVYIGSLGTYNRY